MYYEIIERPTDLQTISQKLCKHKFTTLDEFKAEVRARVVSPVGLGACGAFVVCPGHHLGLFLFLFFTLPLTPRSKVMRIFSNCRTYNAPDTIFYELANTLEVG
jgi:hypothetical protein